MTEYMEREAPREELVNALQVCHDEMTKMCEELTALREQLREAQEAVKENAKKVDEERMKHELYRKDGMIEGLKFAIRANGVSGGEVR